MTFLIQSDPALEELRRQLRESEITMFAYKLAAAKLVMPEPVMCDTPGCAREAQRMQRGHAMCEVCALIQRNKRR